MLDDTPTFGALVIAQVDQFWFWGFVLEFLLLDNIPRLPTRLRVLSQTSFGVFGVFLGFVREMDSRI